MTQAAETGSNERDVTFTDAFSSFSVDDMGAAKAFYSKTLGLKVSENEEGVALNFDGGARVFLYPKEDHQPATFTVLNLRVKNIDAAADSLRARGVVFESYTGEIQTDENGVFRGADSGRGPNIAW